MAYNNLLPANTAYQSMPNTGYIQGNQQYVQPYISQNPQNNQIIDNRIMVNGLENVKYYPLAPNTLETLWNIDGKTFYLVSSGATPRVFEYHERNISSENDTQDVVKEAQIIEDDATYSGNDFVKTVDLDNRLNQLSEDVEERLSEIIGMIDNLKTEKTATTPTTNSKPRAMSKATKGVK